MIPPFSRNREHLPPGIHEATWEEFAARYARNKRRRQMLHGLLDALHVLREAGCTRVYVDGSFVTRRINPRDYDVCWDEAGVNVERLYRDAPEFNVFQAGRQAQKDRFGGEFFPAHDAADWRGAIFLDYFQTDKIYGRPKGIVVLNLKDLP